MTTIGVFAAVFDREGRVLCVRQDYGERHWTMPGGRMEAGEDPVSALQREALEEAGAVIRVGGLVGVYSAPYRDDLVLLFTADLLEQRPWTATDEISAIDFFPLGALPEPMSPNTRLRFDDVAAGARSLTTTLSEPGVVERGRSLAGVKAAGAGTG